MQKWWVLHIPIFKEIIGFLVGIESKNDEVNISWCLLLLENYWSKKKKYVCQKQTITNSNIPECTKV